MNTTRIKIEGEEQLAGVIEKIGTPAYCYFLPVLRRHIEDLKRAFGGYPTQFLFATMANDHPEVLRAIAQEGVGACVNSMRHLELAVQGGFPPEKIQFTSTGTPVSDMVSLQGLRISVNLDSPSQVALWCRQSRGAKAGIRVNAASLMRTNGATADRIGMEVTDIASAQELARDEGGSVNGLHVYAGTNFQKVDALLPKVRTIFQLAAGLPGLEYINIGGGIGIDYSHSSSGFDIQRYGAEVTSMALELAERLGRAIRLIVEPGRWLVGESGRFVVRVTDVKLLHQEIFVAVDASIATFPRPYHHPESLHQVRLLRPSRDSQNRDVTIVGRTTFSRDILGRSCLPASLNVGDLLAFDDAGAYCQSMSSRFLGQTEPVCLIADD